MKSVLIVGPGRSGKDTFARMLAKHMGETRPSVSTSTMISMVMSSVSGVPVQILHAMRHEMRDKWAEAGDSLRTMFGTGYLMRIALAHTNIVTGVRKLPEIKYAFEHSLFDEYVWMERDGIEPDTTLTFKQTDLPRVTVVANNGSLEELEWKAKTLAKLIKE